MFVGGFVVEVHEHGVVTGSGTWIQSNVFQIDVVSAVGADYPLFTRLFSF